MANEHTAPNQNQPAEIINPQSQAAVNAMIDLTGGFCTSGSEREFTLEGSWYADQEIQAGADRDAAAAG